jgi:hypothetical protein
LKEEDLMAESDGALDYALMAMDKATTLRSAGTQSAPTRGGIAAPAELPGLDFSFRSPSFLSARSRWALLGVLAAGGFLAVVLAYRMAVEVPADHGGEWVLPPIMCLVVAAVAFALAYATVMGFGNVELRTSVGGGAAQPDNAGSGTPSARAGTPSVSAVAPPEGATGIAVSTEIVATFSGSIDPDSMSATAFTLRRSGGGAPLAAAVSLDADGRTARLRPAAALEAGATYEAFISGSVMDRAGMTLGRPKVWGFSTVTG